MNPKIFILPVGLAIGLGAIYLLPSAGSVANTAINMKLPTDEGGWVFREVPPSKAELEALAADTEFSKANCFRPRPGEVTEDGKLIPDRLDLSIVLSGYDINNSIHRPERCMRAQGHTIVSESDVTVKLANGRSVTARRLLSKQTIPTSEDRKTNIELKCVTYYFFVGHDKIVHGHLTRTLLDMKDRLLHGMDQRWAYASLSMWFGNMPWNPDVEITEQEADTKVAEFIKNFAEEQINWKQVQP